MLLNLYDYLQDYYHKSVIRRRVNNVKTIEVTDTCAVDPPVMIKCQLAVGLVLRKRKVDTDLFHRKFH